MAPTRSPKARLTHILFHIEGVRESIKGQTPAAFVKSYPLQRTVERAVEIISEAVKSLPPQLLQKHPSVDWPKIIAIGNILRHEYQNVDAAIMWDIASTKLPEVETVIRAMLADIE
jgi:uncharacterized protein with HEPN domain